MVHKRLLLLLAFACFLYWHRSGSRSTKQTHQSNTRLKPLCERIVLYIRFRPYARRLTGLHSALSHTHTRSCALSLTAHAALLLSSLHCHSHLSLSLSLYGSFFVSIGRCRHKPFTSTAAASYLAPFIHSEIHDEPKRITYQCTCITIVWNTYVNGIASISCFIYIFPLSWSMLLL